MIKRTLSSHWAQLIVLPSLAIVAFLVASLLLAGTSGTAQASPTSTDTTIPSPTASPTPYVSMTPTPVPTPTPLPIGMAYSDLDGVAAPIALAHRLPLAIMIDDNRAARPQSGISSASIVYQAPADGGEDRYMFVFQEGTATDIGPTRSARPYYVLWATEYKALYGHVGGDKESRLTTIPANINKIYNMDDLKGGSCPYRRIATTIRPRPHNLYTTSAELIRCAAKMHYPALYQNLPTRPFRGDTPLAQRPTAQTISIAYRTGLVGYQYDPKTDSYQRSIDGKPEIDPANNANVYARSVVVMRQTLSYDSVSDPGHSRPVVTVTGTGPAVVYQEGKAISGTWVKKTANALTRFYDTSGKEIQLVRGEIFLQCIPPSYKVTVQ